MPSTPHPGGDASEIAQSAFAEKQHKLLKLLGGLHSTGVQQQLSLPQIAVLGSQSVGKSSLIESISGIHLPRDTGTCTRCPMECRLQRSNNAWTCKVSLRFQVDTQGNDLPETRDVPFGPDLKSPNDVERRLRQAQRALLRPDLHPEVNQNQFLDDSDLRRPGTPLSFTANCVCILISGSDVTDLHFYDLPGLIANVKEGQNESDIDLVRSLAIRYIKKPGCIILLVVSCDTDFENQGAGRLARQIDKNGDRTVGVLTKPDRAEPETVAKWQNINSDFKLKSGWFVLKLPDPTELKKGITWAVAKRNAAEWFRTNEAWRSFAQSNSHRVGTQKLTEYLSQRLSEQLNHQLPELRATLSARIAETKKELMQLPSEFKGDPGTEVFKLVNEFGRDVIDLIDGRSDNDGDGMVQQLHMVYDRYKVAIRLTVPLFDARKEPVRTDAIEPCRAVSLRRSRLSSETNESVPNLRPADCVDVDECLDVDSDGEDMAIDVDDNPSIHVQDVMAFAKRARTRELPGNFPFSVQEHYIRQFIERWSEPTTDCFDEASDVFENKLEELVRYRFRKYEHGGLLDNAMDGVRSHFRRVRRIANAKLEKQLEVEKNRFYTQNEHYFFDYKARTVASYKYARRGFNKAEMLRQRLSAVESANLREQANTALSALAAMGIHVKAPDLAKLLPADPMDQALEIMAEVRAYFQVAYKRIIDVVPKTIENELITGVQKDLIEALIAALDFAAPEGRDKCKVWVSEPHAITQERNELHGRLKTLEAAKALLSRYA